MSLTFKCLISVENEGRTYRPREGPKRKWNLVEDRSRSERKCGWRFDGPKHTWESPDSTACQDDFQQASRTLIDRWTKKPGQISFKYSFHMRSYIFFRILKGCCLLFGFPSKAHLDLHSSGTNRITKCQKILKKTSPSAVISNICQYKKGYQKWCAYSEKRRILRLLTKGQFLFEQILLKHRLLG